jgi:hypothetical protein
MIWIHYFFRQIFEPAQNGNKCGRDRHRIGGALRCDFLLAEKVRNANDEGSSWKSAANKIHMWGTPNFYFILIIWSAMTLNFWSEQRKMATKQNIRYKQINSIKRCNTKYIIYQNRNSKRWIFKEIKTNKKLDTMPNLTLHSHTPNEPTKWIFELRWMNEFFPTKHKNKQIIKRGYCKTGPIKPP